MNTITFKGICSNVFPNMVVQELPYIIKPRMRTEQYAIDGRSGTVVNELGYESYIKTAKIGLTNSENIDEILSWLDGEGDIIFSNEPNKVYKGQIIDQIDFVRVGRRFRQSENVSWLVYPFKFLKDEPKVRLSHGVDTDIYNMGTVTSLPLIEYEATAPTTIYVNGVSICTFQNNYTNYYVSIDSEDGGIVYNTDTGVSYNGLFTGKFPELKPGLNKVNIVSSGLMVAYIHVRSRFI